MNFPLVETVDKIAHREHPVARFCDKSKPHKIQFSLAECLKLSPDVLEFAVFHELGHWWRVTNVARKRSTFELFPRVESVNGEERFADGFAAFFLNPSKLEREHPEAKLFLERSVGPNEGAIFDYGLTTYRFLLERLEEERSKA